VAIQFQRTFLNLTTTFLPRSHILYIECEEISADAEKSLPAEFCLDMLIIMPKIQTTAEWKNYLLYVPAIEAVVPADQTVIPIKAKSQSGIWCQIFTIGIDTQSDWNRMKTMVKTPDFWKLWRKGYGRDIGFGMKLVAE